MYIPHAFREDNTEKLVEFMQANSFATLVSVLDGLPFASHVPLVVTLDEGQVMLRGHLAKPNAQWQAFGGGSESLVIFAGPHAYVSPSLYEKQECVPTWNYIAVHAYGIPQCLNLTHAPEAVEAMLYALIDNYEPAYRQQWDDLSGKFREGMLKGIIPFEMKVTRLEGKYKLSQNRSRTDQNNVAQALLQNSNPTIQNIGKAMQKNLELQR